MVKALIAGAGIAGVAAGLGLARAGWEVSIFERAEALGEVGAGLQIGPNAAKVLDWLGVLPALHSTEFRPANAVLRDGRSGREIYRAALGAAAEARWGAPYLHLHRADLLAVLVDQAKAAGVEIHCGRTAAAAVEIPGGIALQFEEGSRAEGDMVLAADGVRSALRAGLHPDEAPRYTGQIAWRALVSADRVPKDTLAPDATVWAGAGRHLVSYYIRAGKLINLVAVLEREAWTGEGWSEPGDPDEMRAAFAGWHPAIRTVLGEVEDCFLWGLFDRPEQVRWVRGRLALIGDAAHPMLPFMAQGAGQALEDVASLLRHLGTGGAPAALETALEDWEAERWPRATRVQQVARANGRMFHRGPGPVRAVSRAVVGTVSRLAPGLAAGQLDWLYGADPVRGAG